MYTANYKLNFRKVCDLMSYYSLVFGAFVQVEYCGLNFTLLNEFRAEPWRDDDDLSIVVFGRGNGPYVRASVEDYDDIDFRKFGVCTNW